MPMILHRAAELCFQLDQAQSIEQVRASLERAAGVFGASFFFVVFRSGKSIAPPTQLVVTDYPKRFQRYFDEQRAIEFDPIVMHALTVTGAFRWDGKYRTDRELALQRECIACGMEFGFSCADSGPDGSQLLLCFCGNQPISPQAGDWEHTASASVMLASIAHRTLARIARRGASSALTGGSKLTVAELQTLQMTASAMTAQQVAALLGVKPVTVRYYLARAAEKLGVGSGREAVAKALESGLVDTRSFPRVGFSESASAI
ncbi:MAG: autoinducer binding domain-containing protein [Stagnimonas sp.]|nr:autoinducer binding domain-containing protein [Stagnimonas sp.]